MDALQRAALEEYGQRIRIGSPIGVADELGHGSDGQIGFCERCTFFAADLTGETPANDDSLDWLVADRAVAMLSRESHRWAAARSRRSDAGV